jgi:hypothetical protein
MDAHIAELRSTGSTEHQPLRFSLRESIAVIATDDE